MPVLKSEANHLEKKRTGIVTITRQHLHDAFNWPDAEQRGGLLPILAAIAPYILPVLGGLGAAAGVAGGIAKAVNQAKQAHTVGSGMRTTHDPPDITFGVINPAGKCNGQ